MEEELEKNPLNPMELPDEESVGFKGAEWDE